MQNVIELHPSLLVYFGDEPLLQFNFEVEEWCRKNLRSSWLLNYSRGDRLSSVTGVVVKFSDDVDTLLFKMRWFEGTDGDDSEAS